jgi:hypothetical protein
MSTSSNTPADGLPAADPVMVSITINSKNGHDSLVETLDNAVNILTERVRKFGQWLYIDGKRHRLDPNSSESVDDLRHTLSSSAAPAVRVTGALRGGVVAITTKELKAKAKDASIRGFSKMKRTDLLAALHLDAPSKAPSKVSKGLVGKIANAPAGTVCVSSDEDFTKLKKGEQLLGAFILRPSRVTEGTFEVVLHTGINFKTFEQQLASLVIAELNPQRNSTRY